MGFPKLGGGGGVGGAGTFWGMWGFRVSEIRGYPFWGPDSKGILLFFLGGVYIRVPYFRKLKLVLFCLMRLLTWDVSPYKNTNSP